MFDPPEWLIGIADQVVALTGDPAVRAAVIAEAQRWFTEIDPAQKAALDRWQNERHRFALHGLSSIEDAMATLERPRARPAEAGEGWALHVVYEVACGPELGLAVGQCRRGEVQSWLPPHLAPGTMPKVQMLFELPCDDLPRQCAILCVIHDYVYWAARLLDYHWWNVRGLVDADEFRRLNLRNNKVEALFESGELSDGTWPDIKGIFLSVKRKMAEAVGEQILATSTGATEAKLSDRTKPVKPAWQRLKLRRGHGGDIATLDGREYRLPHLQHHDFLAALQRAKGTPVKAGDLGRPDRLYTALPCELQNIIEPPGRGQTGYRMLPADDR